MHLGQVATLASWALRVFVIAFLRDSSRLHRACIAPTWSHTVHSKRARGRTHVHAAAPPTRVPSGPLRTYRVRIDIIYVAHVRAQVVHRDGARRMWRGTALHDVCNKWSERDRNSKRHAACMSRWERRCIRRSALARKTVVSLVCVFGFYKQVGTVSYYWAIRSAPANVYVQQM